MVVTSPAVPLMVADNIDITSIVELLEKQLYMQSLELIALGTILGVIMTILFVRWLKNG